MVVDKKIIMFIDNNQKYVYFLAKLAYIKPI